jgi:hypothetical protein
MIVILLGMVFDVDKRIECSEMMEREKRKSQCEDVRANTLNLVTCVYLTIS